MGTTTVVATNAAQARRKAKRKVGKKNIVTEVVQKPERTFLVAFRRRKK